MNKRSKSVIILFLLFFCFLSNSCFANILSDWKDERAYKPRPVLFLHGLNSNPAMWGKVTSGLSPWFSKYQSLAAYLETMDFQDKVGSIDTYSNGTLGWADRLKDRLEQLLDDSMYGFYTDKLNLVCYSMGGLAAREFLTNPKYPSGYVDKVILISVPNLGSPLAETLKNIVVVFKIGSMIASPLSMISFSYRNSNDSVVMSASSLDIGCEAAQDIKPGSVFLETLNNRQQPQGVEFYAIYGVTGNIFNNLLFQDFYGGDGVVSVRSQLGSGRISFTNDPFPISAFHVGAVNASITGENPLLKFLDSDTPQLEITSPSASGTTDVYGSSVCIQGKVYNEYLPADTKLLIKVIEESSGKVVSNEERAGSVKPSDFWVPNDSASCVGELDETIDLTGSGKYKITCQLKNPAGLTSETKEFSVNLIKIEGTNIIVHCHNPEGKEIASIQGLGQYSVEIYDGNTRIGYGAHNINTHNSPIKISTGPHTIKAKFNGIIKEQGVTLATDETETVTFVFERKVCSLLKDITSWSRDYSVSLSGSFDGHYPDTWIKDIAADAEPGGTACGCYCIFECYSESQAGTFAENGQQTITIGEDSIYCAKSSQGVVRFTRGTWDIGASPGFAVVCNSEIICNLPYPETSFTNWIIQAKGEPAKRSGYFSGNQYGYNSGIDFGTNNGVVHVPEGFSLSCLPARELRIYRMIINPIRTFAYGDNIPVTATTNFPIFKISSVPYDIEEAAV